ncbi:5-oxoprolinase subunit PxpA [Alteromonas sp. BMJM2]|uniref:5-oxoprolinase subunit PxpA n=1 Tax=Alteromonas sp. BMJM2 TaxID=2954241 RepID=UPI0022B5E0E1|nr:5-oxoprolinase subunit PxpA [Alteromonas sp. BMJM2]
MKLNCDLGESFGAWSMPVEKDIMSEIDQANIACGFHAGDPLVMKAALDIAKAHGVSVGAHPSYPDLQGFGRRSMAMQANELSACIQYQVSALIGMAAIVGTTVDYVKPHGALYNDMMKNKDIRQTVMKSVAAMCQGTLPLMVQATSERQEITDEAKQHGVSLLFEAFSDRRYTDEGYLQSRQIDGAVLSSQEALVQAKQLIEQGTVITASGATLSIQADSLCVHGDTTGAVEIARQIRAYL